MILFQLELLLLNIRIKSTYYMMSIGFLGCAKVSISLSTEGKKFGHLMCPKPFPTSVQDIKWSERMESCRKDVEILKAQWRCLR